jgi:hypothetical protein
MVKVFRYDALTMKMLSAYALGHLEGLNYLLEKNYKELIAMIDAIRDDSKALKYLMDNKYYFHAAFVNAIWEDEKAFQLLLKHEPDLAAASRVIDGDSKAQDMLEKRGKKEVLEMAFAIQKRIREDGDRAVNPLNAFTSIFKKKK